MRRDDWLEVWPAKSPASTSATRQAAQRGVARDARAGRAAAHDEEVELLVAEPLERRAARRAAGGVIP